MRVLQAYKLIVWLEISSHGYLIILVWNKQVIFVKTLLEIDTLIFWSKATLGLNNLCLIFGA